MRKTGERIGPILAVAMAVSAGPAAAAQTTTDPQQRVFEQTIAPQPLADALTEFSKRSGLQVIYTSEVVAGRKTAGAPAGLPLSDTLSRLLDGTGLEYVWINDRTVSIWPKGRARTALPKQVESQPDTAPTRSLATLEEVVVTAQKREERLQDVPVPVTAINASELLESNQVHLQDYYTRIPALSVVPFGVNGAPSIAIRGVTSGAGIGNPTVGITVDDVPYGSSTSLGGGAVAPDLDPSDLQRVEVLRGPQGTLYGASSIGGLMKFVTIDPSTAGVSARVQADVNTVHNGDGPGYGLRLAANVPLSPTLAIRVSGFARRDPGYVDNVQTGEHGVNWTNASGARLSGLWRPDDSFSVKLSALLQHSTVHGSSEVDPTLGDLEQSFIQGVGETDRQSQVYNLNVKAKFGPAELT
jgi:iron complex outermembrane recepter protein